MDTETYDVRNWGAETVEFVQAPPLPPRIIKYRYLDIDLPEERVVSVLPMGPTNPRCMDIPSTFYSSAKEIEAKPML